MKNNNTKEIPSEGQSISIYIGGALGLSCVVTQFVHGRVGVATDKAIQVIGSVSGKACWFPKKALESKGDWFQLAKWFRADSYQERWIEVNESIGGVSA